MPLYSKLEGTNQLIQLEIQSHKTSLIGLLAKIIVMKSMKKNTFAMEMIWLILIKELLESDFLQLKMLN